ncbi:MAG TPA: tetratricopeptide repeat protein [Myxococcota bacterium]|nr:tetratricopeptide repeat protein [Myxococcota bacterium]
MTAQGAAPATARGLHSARGRRLLADAALVLLVLASYAPSLDGDFVFDDRLLVVENEMVAEPPWNLTALFEPSVGGRINYRPLRTLSYRIDYQLAGGLEPAVFHASNLVYHAAVVLSLHALARALLAPLGALFAAALFAVHPLGSEAVAYVAGRRDLLCALFAILSLRAWWSFLDRRAAEPLARVTAPLLLALGLLLASLAAKETALVLPLLAGLLAVVHARGRRGSPAPAPVSYAMLFRAALAVGVVAILLYPDRFVLAWHRLLVGPLAPQPGFSLRVLGQYAWLAVWPGTLMADYRHGAFPLPTASLDGTALVAAAALAGVVVAGVALLLRGRTAGAGLLWFLVALLPVAQIVPYSEVISEHNAYLPLAGLALAAGEAFDVLARRRRTLALVAGAIVLVALAGRSFVRSADWRDDVTLWSASIEAAPQSLRAHYNLGVALRREGRLPDAEASFARAVAIDPRDVDSLIALAEARGRAGDYRAAAQIARQAIQVGPSAEGYAILGWARVALGSPFAARKVFRKALAIDGANEDAIRGLQTVRKQLRPRTRIRTGDEVPRQPAGD